MTSVAHPRPAVLAAAATAALILLAPTTAVAQEGCQFGEGTRSFVQSGLIVHVSAPHFVCADGVEIWADSAVAYRQSGMSHLMGSVRYVDRTRELRADTARYFSEQARLQATGHVFIQDEGDGSQVENGVLVYLRQADFREVESMTVTTGPDGVRPRALVAPSVSDTASGAARPPGEPYAVVGDRIELEGDSYFRATGDVEINRDSLFAYADTAEFDQVDDRLILLGSARVLSRGSELYGRTITMAGPGSDSSRIHARNDAYLVGEGVRLTSPQVVVFLVEGALDRLVATPLARRPAFGAPAEDAPADSAAYLRPVALLEQAELTGDSIEVVAPGERVQRVVSVGRARSVSTAGDSLNVELLPELARSDWLRGDTVIVTFRPRGATVVDAVPDTLADPLARTLPTEGNAPPGAGAEAAPADDADQEIESVAAHGSASALYRLSPSDTTARAGVDPPALHYVVGQSITITMEDGQVADLHVTGQTRGVHLEPLARRAVADSLGAVVDTLGTDTLLVPADTGAIPPDTSRLAPDTLPDTARVLHGDRPGRAQGAPQAHSPRGRRAVPFGSDFYRQPVARREDPWTRT